MLGKLNVVKLKFHILPLKEEVPIKLPKMSACFFQVESLGQPAPFFMRAQIQEDTNGKHAIVYMST
jgi:hypothetical protein